MAADLIYLFINATKQASQRSRRQVAPSPLLPFWPGVPLRREPRGSKIRQKPLRTALRSGPFLIWMSLSAPDERHTFV